jgi:hypothetical protein
VIFLDEPTTGLDPRGRQAVWQVVGGLAAAGVTVLLTTQYLEEADRLADRIAVLDGGRVVADGTPDQLKEQVAGQRLDHAELAPRVRRQPAGHPGHRNPAWPAPRPPRGGQPRKAVAWCLAILVASVAVSGVLFRRRPAARPPGPGLAVPPPRRPQGVDGRLVLPVVAARGDGPVADRSRP